MSYNIGADNFKVGADDLIADQTGNSGLFLTTDGSVTSWAAAGGASPLTTKGDVYTFSTVDARLGVGTNGQVLSADSAEATGLKWITLSSGVTGSGTSGKLTKWSGSSTVGDSIWSEGANGQLTGVITGGAGPAFSVDNGSATGDVFRFLRNGVTSLKMNSSGWLMLNASRNGESDPTGYYALVASNSGGAGNAWSGTGTYAAQFTANSTASTSFNCGLLAGGAGGNHNVAINAYVYSATGSSPRAYAVFGSASTSGTPTSYAGGFFQCTGTDSDNGTLPTGVTAGLGCSNRGSTADIFLARDNTTDVFKIVDGGTVEFLTNASLAAVADKVQLGGYDIAASRRTLAIGVEETVTAEVVVSDATLVVRINGTNYKICLKT